MKRFLFIVVFLALTAVSPLYALVDTVYVASDVPPSEGNLNNAIAANIGDLNNKVFKLEAYGLYILSATITIPAGQHLTIVGPEPGSTQATAPAQILWTSSTAPDTRFNFDCFGDITLKHIWLLYARTDGSQVGSSLQIENNDSSFQNGYFEDVIFDYSPVPQNASGAVGITAPHFRGVFKNCYFRNLTDSHFRYYGRAVSFPFGTTGWHTDSISFTNCTFANMGYVYMQEGAEYADYVSFNHCTFLNSMMFTLESPWWHWLSVTNSIYVNAYMFGDIISQRGGGMYPNGGAISVDSISTFGFSVPFIESERHILFAHNSYKIETWLSAYMDHGNPYSDTAGPDNKPNPQPMMNDRTISIFNDDIGWPYASMFNNYDNTDPGFLLAPTNVERIKEFLLKKWTDNSDISWAFDTATAINGIWPLSENLRYTNATLRTAGMGGLPLGDLYRWDKTRYNTWLAQEATEKATIENWLTNGVTEVKTRPGIPEKFELAQNFPNPFNPVTKIDYSIPRGEEVSLKVYDLVGREVATLQSGYQGPGNYTASFDGGKFPSGVYYYRLEAGSTMLTGKMTLIK